MSAQPPVSLLIPTFNNASTVAETLDSCLAQTFTDLEILVYDEASRDGTLDILRDYEKRDSRIRVLSSPDNSGPVMAWRKLLHEARGDYFTFVWSDDLLMPRYVEVLKNTLDENPAHLLAGCATYYECLPGEERSIDLLDAHRPRTRDTGTAARIPYHSFETIRLPADAFALGLLAGVFPFNQICNLYRTGPTRKVFDRHIHIDNPYGFDYARVPYGNDIGFVSELALLSGEVVQCGEPLVVLRESENSMTRNALRKHRWRFWLQYVWAAYAAWKRCADLGPRIGSIIGVARDRLHVCDLLYSLGNGRLPHGFHPIAMMRALHFIYTVDKRKNPGTTPQTLIDWLARQGGPKAG